MRRYSKRSPNYKPTHYPKIKRLSSDFKVKRLNNDFALGLQLSLVQISLVQIGLVQIGLVQIGLVQIGLVQIGLVQISPTEKNHNCCYCARLCKR